MEECGKLLMVAQYLFGDHFADSTVKIYQDTDEFGDVKYRVFKDREEIRTFGQFWDGLDITAHDWAEHFIGMYLNNCTRQGYFVGWVCKDLEKKKESLADAKVALPGGKKVNSQYYVDGQYLELVCCIEEPNESRFAYYISTPDPTTEKEQWLLVNLRDNGVETNMEHFFCSALGQDLVNDKAKLLYCDEELFPGCAAMSWTGDEICLQGVEDKMREKIIHFSEGLGIN